MCCVISDKEYRICLRAQPDGDTIIYYSFYSKQCKFHRSKFYSIVNTRQNSIYRNINSKDVP